MEAHTNMEQAQIAKIHAEIGKLIAETGKINSETRWHSLVVLSATVVAIGAIVLKLF